MELTEYRLVGGDGRDVLARTPGTLGGHRRSKVYGRLADEETATAAGYRPCASCLPERYGAWKARSR